MWRALFPFALFVAGCQGHATTALTLTVGKTARPLAAYYSFYVEPLPDMSGPWTFLVVTAVDAAFDCARPGADLDAVSFLFPTSGAGVSTTTVLARRGPDLAGTVGGSGAATLSTDDEALRGYDLDAGTVTAGPGRVAGAIHFSVDGVALDGNFEARRCAALDFIVPG